MGPNPSYSTDSRDTRVFNQERRVQPLGKAARQIRMKRDLLSSRRFCLANKFLTCITVSFIFILLREGRRHREKHAERSTLREARYFETFVNSLEHHLSLSSLGLCTPNQSTPLECAVCGLEMPDCVATCRSEITVSVILTAHNNAALTHRTLLQVFRTASKIPCVELIVLDDGSTEDMSAISALLADFNRVGFTSIYSKVNSPLGYGAANDFAIRKLATGEEIALINNDIIPFAGWLSLLRSTLRESEGFAMVGPLFIDRLMRVAEFGGLVFSDGSAANYLRGTYAKDALPELYRRPTDYISAACVLFRRATYIEEGGFDPKLATGYYEDTEFATRLIARGYQVIIQPAAVVFHEEGNTFGANSPLKTKLMVRNREIFVKSWSSYLQAHRCSPTAQVGCAVLRQHRAAVLWIDDIVPAFHRDSGSTRLINVLNILSLENIRVDFIPTGKDSISNTEQQFNEMTLRYYGVRILPFAQLQGFVLKVNCNYQLIFISRFYIYKEVIKSVRNHCPGIRIVFDTVDLHFLREARLVASSKSFKKTDLPEIMALVNSDPELNRSKNAELDAIRGSAVSIVVSKAEQLLVRSLAPSTPIFILSNVYRMQAELVSISTNGRSGVLFVGSMGHAPNLQAIKFIVDVLSPRARFCTFHIAGSGKVPDNFLTNSPNVAYHGHVTDNELSALYLGVRLTIAPLFSGAGVKGKVCESLLHGVPVIGTEVAFEGMSLQNGSDVLIASGVDEFVSHINLLSLDDELWMDMSRHGRLTVRRQFSFESARNSIQSILKYTLT